MLTEAEIEELYVAYLIIKSLDPHTATEKRTIAALKRIINKHGDNVDWRLG